MKIKEQWLFSPLRNWLVWKNPLKRIPCLFGFHEEHIVCDEETGKIIGKFKCFNLYCPLYRSKDNYIKL